MKGFKLTTIVIDLKFICCGMVVVQAICNSTVPDTDTGFMGDITNSHNKFVSAFEIYEPDLLRLPVSQFVITGISLHKWIPLVLKVMLLLMYFLKEVFKVVMIKLMLFLNKCLSIDKQKQ